MSNILIIKHGSLGDIAQISGVIRDIRENNKNEKIFILTTTPYLEILSKCPFLDGVLLDKRLARWNIFYLLKLKKMLSKFNFSKVFDLQNSSRTSFYRKYLFNSLDWSSSETILEKGEKKKDFDEHSVLQRFNTQLIKSNLKTKHTLNPDFSWAKINVDNIVNKYFGKKFILIFPFCSSKHVHKKWLYFNNLIDIIKSKHKNIELAVAPGPNEIDEAKKLKAVLITNNNLPLNIMELAGLISKADFVIANDTGPAHMSAHLGKKGIVLFGYHTTAKKVSIQTEKFKAISVDDLKNLTPEEVYANIKDELMLIDQI